MNSDAGPSDFQTSDLPPEPIVKDESVKMLDEILLTLKLERAVIFTKSHLGWVVACSHEVPTEDFWNLAPLSLSVIQSAALEKKTIHLVDAGASDRFGTQISVVLTGIRSVACAPYASPEGEVKALLYADNRISTGAFSPKDVETLEELAQELGRRLFERNT